MASEHYPRMIQCPDGATRIVKDHHQHSAHMGIPHDETGQPIEQPVNTDNEVTQEIPMDSIAFRLMQVCPGPESESLPSTDEKPKNKGGRPRKVVVATPPTEGVE